MPASFLALVPITHMVPASFPPRLVGIAKGATFSEGEGGISAADIGSLLRMNLIAPVPVNTPLTAPAAAPPAPFVEAGVEPPV